MNEKAIEARRAYKREWAKNNRDKVRAQQERYWARKAAAAESSDKPEADRPQSGGNAGNDS